MRTFSAFNIGSVSDLAPSSAAPHVDWRTLRFGSPILPSSRDDFALSPYDARVTTIDSLEQRFGAFGPVLRALLELDESLEPLEIILGSSFLAGRADPLPQYGNPRGLLVFLDTGCDDAHAAFLMTGDAPTLDARPVCHVRRDSPRCRVVASSLADFLGLAAIAGAGEIEREHTDAVWRSLRHSRLENDPDGEFRRLSDLLCEIPGVSIPPLPAVVANAHPDVKIEDDGELDHAQQMRGAGTPLERIERVWKSGQQAAAHKELLRQIELWLGISDLVHASNWRALEGLIERLRPTLPDDVRARLRAAGVRV